MIGYIYKVTNLLNNKVYVGKRSGAYDKSYYGSSDYLNRDIAEYGYENFDLVKLEDVHCKNEFSFLEGYWVQKNLKHHDIYNVNLIGSLNNKKRSKKGIYPGLSFKEIGKIGGDMVRRMIMDVNTKKEYTTEEWKELTGYKTVSPLYLNKSVMKKYKRMKSQKDL